MIEKTIKVLVPENSKRFCEQCGKQLVRRERGERPYAFQRRRFCSRACKGTSQMKDVHELSDSALHRRARKFLKPNCESCGAIHSLYASGRSYSLDVHHIDGNRYNNHPDNLMTLCKSCHNKLEWAQGTYKPEPRARCSVCGAPARGHGLCNKHYTRWRRHGDVVERDSRGRPVVEES